MVRIVQRKNVFSVSRYNKYLLSNTSIKEVADKLAPVCGLSVLLEIVSNGLGEIAKENYETIRQERDKTKDTLNTVISAACFEAESAEHIGEIEEARRLREKESIYREALAQEERESTKRLVVPRVLPVSSYYLVLFMDHIAAKIRRKPMPSETARMLSAILKGFDRLPDVDADLLAKRCDAFRENNPQWMKEVKRWTECGPDGRNELDRRFGTTPLLEPSRI